MKPPKGNIVPICAKLSPDVIRRIKGFLEKFIPAWYKFQVLSHAKYLGVMLGPTAGEHSWSAAIQKRQLRSRQIASVGSSPNIAAFLYN